MSETVLVGGRRVSLDDRDLLGAGGEGRVYRWGDRAVKVYFTMTPARRRKLEAFPRGLPPRVVAPLELCTDPNGAVVGYVMRALASAVDAHRLAQRRFREGVLDANGVLALYRDLSRTVAELHAAGVVVGDLNDGNVALTPPSPGRPWTPWLIDADSMQFGAHPCTVAHERFLDPRLYGVELSRTAALSRESDWYALAVLLFSALLYVHPYGGAHPSHPTLLRRAEARCSILRPDVKLPRAAARPDALPDDALAFFTDVFERDVRAPLPPAVLEPRFATCGCGLEHARRTCPACTTSAPVRPAVRARGRVRAVTVFEARRGRIVAASADGPLRFVREEGGALFREDGQRVPAPEAVLRAPGRRVRIAGASTWVLGGGRAVRVVREQIVEDLAIPDVHGEPAADAGPAGLVYVEGDALVRAGSGTRVGQVLGGQTRVRVGAALGFATTRAGRFTLSYVFGAHAGPLRQLDLPHAVGRLVDWTVRFDDRHALVRTTLERSGRVVHTAELVDAHGALVARAEGPPDSSPLFAGIRAICLAGGAVLAAADDGLVLLRADRRARALDPVRAFPETRDIASPDAELLVGPGGSVYVVDRDEITHVCFTDQSE